MSNNSNLKGLGGFNPFIYIKIAVLVIVGFYGYKMFFKNGFLGLNKGSKKEAETEEEKKQIINTISNEINTSKVSVGNVEAEQIADLLYNAMNRIGTDEDAIFSALDGLGTEDFAVIFTKFGVKDYSDGGSPSKLMYALNAYSSLNLVEWFNRELSKKHYNRLKEEFEGKIVF